MKKLLALFLMSMCSLSAHAGESGLVTRIYPTGNTVNFQISNSCKTSMYYQFDITTDIGKAWYAMLLTAANNKKPVSIDFAGACDPNQHQTIWYVYQDF